MQYQGTTHQLDMGSFAFFLLMQNCLTVSELLGIWNEKIQQEDHCIVVTQWLLMQNAQPEERRLWHDSPASQHDLAVGYFSEATETCYFLMKLTSEPTGEKFGQVSSESVDSDVNVKHQFQGWAPITSPHLYPFHSVYARQPHLEQKHFVPLNILCFSLYKTWVCHSHTLCALHSLTPAGENAFGTARNISRWTTTNT